MNRPAPNRGARFGVRVAAATATIVVGLGGLAIAAGPAAAAGGGYAPSTPTPGGTATGLPGSVVTVTTIQPSGGKATATIGTSSVTVTVPSGTFSVPTQAVFTDAASATVTPSNGGSVIVTFGLGFYQNGTKVTGTFPPVTVTISNASIGSNTTVYFVVNGALQAVSGATVSSGTATFTVTSDPTVELTNAAAPTAVASATTVSTGEPFILEGGVAGLLVLAGGFLLIRARKRRTA